MEGSQGLARQEGAVVKAVPVPASLQELGVRIGQDESSGMAVVVIPPQVRQALNVINPVSSFAQADPNWTPAIALVQLDKEAHSYPMQGKLGLNKQALETLGKAAGVLYTRTVRVPKAELQEDELWAYRATVGFRRSDGTIDEVTRERGFNREAEMAEITESVRRNKSGEAAEAEIRKRWIAELRFGPAKTESKAINRALRAGLQVPSSLAPAAFQKPFLVIGYNFTPDYNDVEVKRILVAVGLNAQAAIYGGREVSGELGPAADIEGTPVPDTDPAEGEGPAEEQAQAPEQAGGGKQDEGGGATDAALPDGPAAGSSDEDPEPELEPEEGSSGIKIPEAVIEAAGDFKTSKAKTVRELVEAEKGQTWILWALRNLEDGEERAAIETFVEHRAPELWAMHVESGAGE